MLPAQITGRPGQAQGGVVKADGNQGRINGRALGDAVVERVGDMEVARRVHRDTDGVVEPGGSPKFIRVAHNSRQPPMVVTQPEGVTLRMV